MPVKTLRLSLLDGRFAVCRLGPGAKVDLPDRATFFSITRTPRELSVVCDETDVPDGARVEGGWRALEVVGPLDFAFTGVISSITSPLATAGIPVFVVSTFDTDYLLVREEDLEGAMEVLSDAGCVFVISTLVRLMGDDDGDLMREMLAAAAHADEEATSDPCLSRYMDGWGQDGDLGFVVEDASGESAGAAWVRLFPTEEPGYGYIGKETPELVIGIREGERGRGVGRALLERLVSEATGKYPAISLSVRRGNEPALKLFRRLGFEMVEGREETNRAGGSSIVMRLDLSGRNSAR